MPQLVWLVTGCSSGLGAQFVQSILARGDKVIATGRRLEKLANLERAGAEVLQLDITDNQQSISEVVSKAISIYGRIDVLVNNASYIQIGMWEDLEHDDWTSQLETNVLGTIKVTKALLPHFRQRRSGTTVFISSLSGWIGHAGCGAYAGSKFALEGIVESLKAETSHLGIRTLLIEPGRFRTNLLSSGNMKARPTEIPEYSQMAAGLMEHLTEQDQAQPGDPTKLVNIVLDLVRNEGIAAGDDVPFRLPLGSDAFEDIKAKCEQTLRVLEQWKSVIKSTDIEEAKS